MALHCAHSARNLEAWKHSCDDNKSLLNCLSVRVLIFIFNTSSHQSTGYRSNACPAGLKICLLLFQQHLRDMGVCIHLFTCHTLIMMKKKRDFIYDMTGQTRRLVEKGGSSESMHILMKICVCVRYIKFEKIHLTVTVLNHTHTLSLSLSLSPRDKVHAQNVRLPSTPFTYSPSVVITLHPGLLAVLPHLGHLPALAHDPTAVITKRASVSFTPNVRLFEPHVQ